MLRISCDIHSSCVLFLQKSSFRFEKEGNTPRLEGALNHFSFPLYSLHLSPCLWRQFLTDVHRISIRGSGVVGHSGETGCLLLPKAISSFLYLLDKKGIFSPIWSAAALNTPHESISFALPLIKVAVSLGFNDAYIIKE